MKKLIYWDVTLIVVEKGVPRVVCFCIPGTRTQAVHIATVKVLETHNYKCKIMTWFSVSKALVV